MARFENLPSDIKNGQGLGATQVLFVFASHNVLAIHKDSFGYKLLVAFRKYANMVMFETLEVHTSTTITAGHKAVEEFGIAINAYDKAFSDLPDWLKVDSDSDSDPGSDDEDDPLMQKYNFPKLHNQTHAFGDVEDKEVLCGFSTQLFEGHHKSLKHWYQIKTTFKDIASQILTAEHTQVVSNTIQEQINLAKDADFDNGPSEVDGDDANSSFGNVYLGSPDKATSFDAI
ncbi:hypothetical protein E4T56_gene12116 [Termitomyces sp. T112]|nr:hypothetical protein E4T56_gene12116 [Termitomyces sp. T112]